MTGHGISNDNAPLVKPPPAHLEGEAIGKCIVGRIHQDAQVDRKDAEEFPVDGILARRALSPYRTDTLSRARNHEDHLARPIIPLHYVISHPNQRRFPWKTPGSACPAFFHDKLRCTRSYPYPSPSPPIPLFEQLQPFSRFLHGSIDCGSDRFYRHRNRCLWNRPRKIPS
jgi:hypothetical protein